MNNDRRPDQNEPDAHDVNKTADEGHGVDLSRRRFSRAGLIAAPVIMTLSSKSALGMNYRCTVSGMISGNMSHAGDIGDCMGRTPGYWTGGKCFSGGNKTYIAGSWPSPLLPTTPFHSSYGGVFAGNKFVYYKDNEYKCYNLEEVMRLGGTIDSLQLGAHTVAALLNAKAAELGWSPFGGGMEYGLTPNQVIVLYNTYHASKPLDLKTLFEIWNQDNASTRSNYQSAISQLGIVIPNS